jgi:hypothetical protein
VRSALHGCGGGQVDHHADEQNAHDPATAARVPVILLPVILLPVILLPVILLPVIVLIGDEADRVHAFLRDPADPWGTGLVVLEELTVGAPSGGDRPG